MSTYQGAGGGPHHVGIDMAACYEGPPASQGYPFDGVEGIESPSTHTFALGQEDRFRQQWPGYYEEREHVEIQGHELTENRGRIQVAGAGYYFPNFY